MSATRFPAIAPPRSGALTHAQTPPFRRSSAVDELEVTAATEEELQQLKETLRQQQHRLSSPRQPRRPDGIVTVANPVAGQNYAARPYHRITPRKMWEPSFATDKDIVELNDRLVQSEERLETRKREFEVQWAQRRNLFGTAATSDASPAAPADSTDSPTTRASGSRPTSSKGVAFKDGQRPGSSSLRGSKGGRPASATGNSRESIPELHGDDAFMPMFTVHQDNSKDIPPPFHQTPRDASMRSSTDTMLGVPEALRRRSSSVKVSQGTIAMLAMLDNTPDLSLPAPKEAGFDRSGDILSENQILKQDLFEAAFTRRDMVGIISGAPYFRMVPKFHIGGVAQAHYHGIRAAINELRKAQSDHSCPIVWVNLREEPIIYLNGKSFIIRSRDDPLKPQVIVNISGARIAQVEEKLRREILAEAALNQGNICVHHETANGAIEEQWECVDTESLITLEGIFAQLHQRGLNVEYRRRPITQGAMPTASDFQFVLEICQSYPLAPVIFSCQTGRGRSSLMMLVASIVRFYQMCKQDIQADVTLLRGDGKATSYRTLQQLIALLPNGALHERRVAVLMELSDKIYSIADHINAALRVGQQTEKSRMRLAQYAYLLIFSSYCEQYFWLKETSLPFNKWVDQFHEIKVLLMSITATRFSTTSLASERLATPQGVVESDELTNWIRHKRRGHVLCNNMILRSVPKDLVAGPATSVAGVVALRQLAADVPIFTCGRVSETGREELLYNIRSGCPEVTKIAWVSLRAEPMIFVNGTGYSLLEYNAAIHNGASDSASTMHVSRQRLEEIEERLCKDVEQEAASGDGFVIVHALTMEGGTEALRVKVDEVRTPRNVMEVFAESANVTYIRLPLPAGGHLLASDLDPLINLFEQLYMDAEAEGETLALVLNDGEGGLRTTIALNVATIIRASRLARLRSFNSAKGLQELIRVGDRNSTLSTTSCYFGIEEEETLPAYHVELQAASAIVQMVAAGSLLKAVDAVIALGGSGRMWNLLHAVDFAKNAISGNDKNGPAVLDALEAVRKYLLILLIAIYVDEQGHFPASEREAFSEWLDKYEEIRQMLERLDEHPQAALKLIDHRNLMAGHVADDRTVDRRSGDVLTANFAMKADHFPGCQKKGLVPRVCGAPNFRKVDNINVYGVAIPTILGVHNVLTVLGASERPLVELGNDTNDEEMWRGYPTRSVFDPITDPSSMERPLRGNVVWVNLREEPIIYVGDRPFVFRDLQLPYVNVELTGIEAHKIEHVEEILKADILREADQYDGNFLVHDEGKPGELVGSWELANNSTVRTVRQVYDEAALDGCRVTFLRLPVTDEQSPELKDFDLLVENLLPAVIAGNNDTTEPTSFVFNCQMGRGRTTTGMVVCSLLLGRTTPGYYDFLDQKYPTLFQSTDSELAKGNYNCVTQLKSLLSDGREAKKRLDLVLEACSRMQNLRTAIEGFVQQVSSPDVPEEARARAHHHGIHYLQRYYNLIAFASYLHEEYDEETMSMRSTFVAWMDERPELVNLHNSASLS
jgi:hypothetical protein